MGFKVRALALVGAVGIGGAIIASGGEDLASVVRVIDGDTLIADVEGDEKRVRLLNVDTPELGRDGADSECLAEEASEYLRDKLPAGTAIELRYDEESQDQYGRELAAVYLDEEMVNAEIARQGFGTAVKFEPNDKYYWDVSHAENEAKREKRGVHDSEVECSIPQRVETAATETDGLLLATTVTALSISELNSYIEGLDLHLNKLHRILKAVDHPSDFAKNAYPSYSSERFELKWLIDRVEREIENSEDRLERKTEEAAEKAAAEERREREREETEQRRQEREEAAEARRQSQPPQRPAVADPAPAPQSSRAPAPQPASPGGTDTYTGCRAYGGNYALTSVDDKGRPYAKIDCTSKVQIG